MAETTYHLIDDDLMTELSIRSEQGFLSLIDTEIEDESCTSANDIAEAQIAMADSSDPYDIAISHSAFDEKFEKYRQAHPDEWNPMAGFILSQD